MSVNHTMKWCIAEFHALRHKTSTTYNVLLRYLAYVNRCYSLLPIMLKIFYVISHLAGDVYEKRIIFPYFSRILSLQVRQSLFTITLNNLQVAVFHQRLNRADKNKSTVSVLCPIFSAMLHYMSDINLPDNNMNKN